MNDFDTVIKNVFRKVMDEEACDLAELVFNSANEKSAFIENAWNDYGDDIEEHIIGSCGEGDAFLDASEEKQKAYVRKAIKDNSDVIFDDSFLE